MSQRLRPHAVVDLREYAERCNVSDMVRFLGHVAHTDRVLASCDALISPSRLSHPWGRAIIEALAAGKPVVATGTYDRFVKPGVTGLLHATYDPQAMARDLVMLADDAEFAGRLGAEGAQLISSLCDGANQAAELKHVWRHTLAALAARKAARNAAAAMAAAAA